MRVLIVKISSMGDLIHALPALSDAVRVFPEIRFDWAVEKGFSAVPLWHSHVDRVITSSHRIWKRNLWQTNTRKEITTFLRDLRSQKYDLIIDAQSSIKSAVVTSLAKGPRCGMDKDSVREWGAHLVYQKKIHVPRQQHAMLRLRQLFAGAFGYDCPTDAPNFGLDSERLPQLSFDLPKRYLIFVHHASWASKCWPEMHWHSLIKLAEQAGYTVLLPWGSANEKNRAERLAFNHENAMVLPTMTLSELARLFLTADGAVCCDTGLGHLSNALAIPTVTLYGPTDPYLLGITGKNQIHLQSTNNCVLCYKRKCSLQEIEEKKPVCLTEIRPETVWERLISVIRS